MLFLLLFFLFRSPSTITKSWELWVGVNPFSRPYLYQFYCISQTLSTKYFLKTFSLWASIDSIELSHAIELFSQCMEHHRLSVDYSMLALNYLDWTFVTWRQFKINFENSHFCFNLPWRKLLIKWDHSCDCSWYISRSDE